MYFDLRPRFANIYQDIFFDAGSTLQYLEIHANQSTYMEINKNNENQRNLMKSYEHLTLSPGD